MADRIKAVTVLEKDMSATDVEKLLNAIRQMRNVLTVTTHVASIDDEVAYARARAVYGKAMWDVLLNETGVRR